MEYTVLQTKPKATGGEIILCFLPTNKVTPWATWFKYTTDTGEECRIWGHYFYESEGLEAALADFKER